MYNLRYHIVSIVAVFLALALGLVLGGLIGGEGPSALQTGLANDILRSNSETRAQSAQVRDENKRLTAFSNDTLGPLIQGRLNGRTILVIGAQDGASKHAVDLVETAGGAAVIAELDVTQYQADDQNLKSVTLASELKQRYKVDDDLSALAAGLAAEWAAPGAANTTGTQGVAVPVTHPVTAALQADGILKLSGDASSSMKEVDGVINVALAPKGADPDSFALTVSQAFKEKGTAVIAAQGVKDTNKLGSVAAERGLCATNLFDSPIGDWTVVAVMGGAEQATYGTLDGAAQIYPSIK